MPKKLLKTNLEVYFRLMKTLLTKKILFDEENQNSMFKDSIRIFQGLFEFIEGLITRKIYF